MKSGPSPDNNPFARHSTLLGTLSAVVVVTALGWLTHWRWELIPAYMLAFGFSFVRLARLFYGLDASRNLDKELISPESHWDWDHSLYDIDEPGYQVSRAYQKARTGDASALERLAEEEQWKEASETEPRPNLGT